MFFQNAVGRQNFKLSISESLLTALDYPHVLIIERAGRGIVLYQRGNARATGKERKVAYPQRAMPRMAIGLMPAQELGLIHGPYSGWVDGDAIYALPGEF